MFIIFIFHVAFIVIIHVLQVNAIPLLLNYRDHSIVSDNNFRNFIKGSRPTAKSYSISFKNNFNGKEESNFNINFKPMVNRDMIGLNMVSRQTIGRGCNMDVGSYLDICGECADDQTIHKVDKCHVCEGDNRCNSCDADQPESRVDSCGTCTLPFDDSWNNCSKIVDILPKVIDKAASERGVVQIFLTRSLGDASEILCQIILNDNILIIEQTAIDETVLTVTFILPDSLGECNVACNGIDNITSWGERNITLVDSHALVLTSLQPVEVVTGEQFQMMLQVHKIVTLVDLICYVTYNASVIAYLPTNEIEGNPLMSTVRCPMFRPKQSGMYYVGIAYTRLAISKLTDRNAQRLIVHPNVPKMIMATFTQELQSVCIEFDHNIAGPSECSRIFIARTLTLFGEEPTCGYNTNQLCVHLGKRARVMPGDVLELSDTNGVYSALSDNIQTQVIGSVRLAEIQMPRPAYQLLGPNFICPQGDPSYFRPTEGNRLTLIRNSSRPLVTSTISIITQGLQELKYNWSVGFDIINNSQSVTPSQRQRRNLLIWFTAREMMKLFNNDSVNDININANMIIPNIRYKLKVIGRNYIGVDGLQVNKTVQLASLQQGLTEIIVYAPIGVTSIEEILIESKIIVLCSNKTVTNHNSKFIWEVKNENTPINLPSHNGPRLKIPPGILNPGKLYDITCKLVASNSSVLAVGKTNIFLQSPRIEAYIYPSELVVGTGHTIELHCVVSSQQLDINDFQFMWTCRTSDGHSCIVPGTDPIQLELSDSTAFQKAVLKLKPGSLAVGRYILQVAVKVPGVQSSTYSEPSVLIIASRNPPIISVVPPAASLLDPSRGYTIPAVISDIGPECILTWNSLAETTFEYLPLESVIGNNFQTELPLDFTASVKHFPLIFPPNNLIKNGTQYKFRLEAQCGVQSSHVDLVIKVPSLPVVKHFQVVPLEGVALETSFHFSTNPAIARIEDFPLTYSFGYMLPSSARYFFYTSQVWLSAEMVLPADGAEVSAQIVPLLKVCTVHKACSLTLGTHIKTRLPNQVSEELVRELSNQLITTFDLETINEGQGLAVSILNTLKHLKDQSAYTNISNLVTSLTLNQITLTTSRLDTDKTSLPTAVSLLEAITTLLSALPTSETILMRLVTLRDKILTLIKQNSSRPARAEFLPVEPRYGQRIKRQQPVSNSRQFLSLDMIKNLLKTSEATILNFNSQEKSLIEKQKLLNNLDDYVSELCKDQRNNHDIYLGFRIVSLSVQTLSVSENVKTPLSVPMCTSNCTLLPAILTLGRMFSSHYKIADSICLAGIGFTTDILSETHNISTNQNVSRVSNVYRMQVLVYSNTQGITRFKSPQVTLQIPVDNSSVAYSSFKFKCKVWVNGWIDRGCDTIHQPQGVICKCPAYSYYSVFAESMQVLRETTTTTKTTSTSTTTVRPTTKPPQSLDMNYITTLPSVFHSSSRGTSASTSYSNLKKSTHPTVSYQPVHQYTSNLPFVHETTSSQMISPTHFSPVTHKRVSEDDLSTVDSVNGPEKFQPIKGTTLTSKKVAFKIEEDFETVTRHGVAKFEKLLKQQILEQTNISDRMVEDLYVTEGSIMVTLELQDTEEQTVDEAIPQLAKVLSRGYIRLVGPDEQELKVPVQGLQVLDYQQLASTKMVTSASLMPAMLLGSILLVSSIVVAVLITKQRRDLESTLRISQRIEQSAMPRYLRPQYEQTLDGAASTLPKFPSSSNMAPILSAASGGEELDSGIVLITDKDEQKKKTSFISGKIQMTTDIAELNTLPGTPNAIYVQ